MPTRCRRRRHDLIRAGLACALTVVAGLAFAGCGSASQEQGGAGGSDPEAVVSEFVRIAGGAADSKSALRDACSLLSPDIRPGMRFDETVHEPSDEACVSALALALYYTGDTGEVDPPQRFSGKVVDAVVSGDEAVVSLDMTYTLESGPRSHAAKVLAVQRDGAWWIATPFTLNLLAAMDGVTEADLRSNYAELLRAADTARAQTADGDRASTHIEADLDPCPRSGASRATDASGDVRMADGGHLADMQSGDSDLVAVTHAADGDQLCFELQFAGAPPGEGGVELTTRPDGDSVLVQWDIDGRVIGEQYDMGDDPRAVEVKASRDEHAMTLRAPASTFGDTQHDYRWAVEVAMRTSDAKGSLYDSLPDDLTIFQERDQYIPHAR